MTLGQKTGGGRQHHRGQTLLLWALSLLILTLMVCMVLSVGTRVREKIETQTMADTAAFSNAVATARTFNSVSLMNRTQISHMVAQAGAQSLINWTSHYLSALGAAHWNLTANFAQLNCTGWTDIACPCKTYTRLMLIVQSISMWIEGIIGYLTFYGLEIPAALQARDRWTASMALYALEMESYNLDLQNGLTKNQKLADRVSNGPRAGNRPGELSAPANGDVVTNQEIGISLGCLTSGGAGCNPPVLSEHAVEAAMGSRGFPFVTSRFGGTNIIRNKIQSVLSTIPTPLVTSTVNLGLTQGAGYWSPMATLPMHGMIPPLGTYSWADDHTLALTVATRGSLFPGCGATSPWPLLSTNLKSGNFIFGTSYHFYFMLPQLASLFAFEVVSWPAMVPAVGLPITPLPILPPLPFVEFDSDTVHRVSNLPWFGVWPLFIDYNFSKVGQDTDNFGQPKNMAVIQRDYAARSSPDPFNLFFQFRFSQGSTFDNRGLRLSTPPNTDISKMMAVSTGITYYHRASHWKEPPNFLSPFWRATLVAADTDDAGRTDPATLMNSVGNPEAAALWNALQAQGFKGIQ